MTKFDPATRNLAREALRGAIPPALGASDALLADAPADASDTIASARGAHRARWLFAAFALALGLGLLWVARVRR